MQGAKRSQSQASSTPSLSQAIWSAALDLTQEDEDQARRQAEVAATTELIDSFQQHSTTWDALEVWGR